MLDVLDQRYFLILFSILVIASAVWHFGKSMHDEYNLGNLSLEQYLKMRYLALFTLFAIFVLMYSCAMN
jgi:hypothetical protein